MTIWSLESVTCQIWLNLNSKPVQTRLRAQSYPPPEPNPIHPKGYCCILQGGHLQGVGTHRSAWSCAAGLDLERGLGFGRCCATKPAPFVGLIPTSPTPLHPTIPTPPCLPHCFTCISWSRWLLWCMGRLWLVLPALRALVQPAQGLGRVGGKMGERWNGVGRASSWAGWPGEVVSSTRAKSSSSAPDPARTCTSNFGGADASSAAWNLPWGAGTNMLPHRLGLDCQWAGHEALTGFIHELAYEFLSNLNWACRLDVQSVKFQTCLVQDFEWQTGKDLCWRPWKAVLPFRVDNTGWDGLIQHQAAPLNISPLLSQQWSRVAPFAERASVFQGREVNCVPLDTC